MQGKTQSSEALWTVFNSITTASSRIVKWLLKIAWTRVVGTEGFATVGTSLIGGLDTVRGNDGILSESDKFQYWDETDRLVRFEYDRVLQEPLGGLAMAIGDLVLENTDGRFTPDQNATIGTAILPNRPLQMFFGFLVGSVERVIPLLKGLTKQPQEQKAVGTISINCYDYIQFLNEWPIETTVYISQRSDQIIESLLTTIGFGTSQYVLDEGLNTITYAGFKKGDKAGEIIKKICEAEEAVFYQDESGVLRFENRRHFSASPHNTSVWDIDPDDVVIWDVDYESSIINRVLVKVKPKELGTAGTEIWKDGVEEVVERGEIFIIYAEFETPVYALTAIAATTDYTAYTGSEGTGTDITSSLSIATTLYTNTVKLEITNNGAQRAWINFLRLRGTPIVDTPEIIEQFEDTVSVSKYGDRQLEIENEFINDVSFAHYLARAIVRKYKEPKYRIKLTIQGIPQLQLRDKVRVKDPELGTYKDYRVMRIQGSFDNGLFTQVLTLREVVTGEADSWAIVGTTILDSQTEFVGI